jgi:predicted PurR-regulated permease PerM
VGVPQSGSPWTDRFSLSVTDPQPLTDREEFWRLSAYGAVIGIFLLMLGAFLGLTRTLLLPVLSAAIVGAMLGPASAWAERHRVPSWLFATLSIVFVIGLMNVAIFLLAQPVTEWIAKAPEIGATVSEKLQILERPMAVIRELQNAVMAPLSKNDGSLKVDVSQSNLFAPIVSVLTPAVGELLVFLGTLFFYLLGRMNQRKFLISLFETQEARLRVLRILNDAEHNLARYVGVVSVINVAVGLMTGGIAYMFGLPNAALWAMLAFVLNYLPYVGPATMFLVLFIVALITLPSLLHALAPPLLFAAMTTIEGHLITPSIIGRQLALSPIGVFLSLAFWTWLWGPAGAFLAVPLLIVGLVAFDHLYPNRQVELPE